MSRWDGFKQTGGTRAELEEGSRAMREEVRRQKEILTHQIVEPMPNFKAFIHVACVFVFIALLVPWFFAFMDGVLEAYTSYARWVSWLVK